MYPGMRLTVWRTGIASIINDIVTEDTYIFLGNYKTVAGEDRYVIKNSNNNKEHDLDACDMIYIFNLSAEDPDKEDEGMSKLRINAVEPGMMLEAVKSIPALSIYAGNNYRVDTIERDMIDDRYRIRLYYPPTGTYYLIKEDDFINIFDLREDYRKDKDLQLHVDFASMHPPIERYIKSDVSCTEEVIKTRFVMIPVPKFIQVNGDYTTAVWKDGSHTVVKLAEGDVYDEDELYMILAFKKMFSNNNSAMRKYFSNYKKNVRRIKE